MKVPNDALTIIAAAASKTSTRIPSEPASGVSANAESFVKPRLTVRLRDHLEEVVPDENRDIMPAATRLLEESSASCDASFLRCILSPVCRGCFQTLQENSVDWANVVPETPCQDVLGFLVAGGHCTEVRQAGVEEQDTFCSAFDSCVIWDEEDEHSAAKKEGDGAVDSGDVMSIECSALTECTWPGMHEHFLGDGVCHDAMPGCYNSQACGYDGGDCCEDTCHYPSQTSGGEGDDYGKCGMEGFACRDPSSIHCQPALARMYKEFCAVENDEGESGMSPSFDDDLFKEEEALPECGSSDSLYRLVQYDSWGDGWDDTVLALREHGSDEAIYEGGLKFGSQGTVHLCLTKKDPKCYHITVENGVWGNEISWELRPLAGGAPALAAGGSPSDCTVPLMGAVTDCPNTCQNSRPDTKISDPNYKSYKDMEACIEKKCLIQVGNCAQDDSCSDCMQESSPDYCYANENFSVLIDCSMCSCTEVRPAYCDAKASGAAAAGMTGSSAATHDGNIKPATAPGGGASIAGSATGGTAVCGPEQTLKGTSSLVAFAECADVDEMMAMVTDFDNDNFGMLDMFESCAHTYDEEVNHGGKSALDCMKILHGLIVEDENEDEASSGGSFKNAKGEPLPENIGKAISTLAQNLYHDAENFCECSSNVNKDTPTCSSFVNFKTLLYEAVDACKSLDAIDCAAWEEFYTPCKKNLLEMYDEVDFEDPRQCSYVSTLCGGAGPFPAFRRLDCGGEIAKSAWDFHTMYERGCLKSTSSSSSSGTVPSPMAPLPTPLAPSTPTSPSASSSMEKKHSSTEKKQYKPYDPNGASDQKKTYYSSSDPEEPEPTDSDYTEKKTHHYLRNIFILMVLTSVGYFVHKRRRENFNYARFRQMREARNYAGGLTVGSGSKGGEYMGVSMTDSCSFEPPTLPPTPSDNTTMI